MQRNLKPAKALCAISIALIGGAHYFDRVHVKPTMKTTEETAAQLSRELQASEGALESFRTLLDLAPERVAGAEVHGSIEEFWVQTSRELRRKAIAAGLRSPRLSVIENASGGARSAGLLTMPPEIADTVYFSFAAQGRYPSVVKFIRMIDDMPVAVSRLKSEAGGAVTMEFAAWRVKK